MTESLDAPAFLSTHSRLMIDLNGPPHVPASMSGCSPNSSGAGRGCVLAAIHSFTPVYLGRTREWHAGVLFERAVQLADSLIRHLSRDGLNVGANVPYGVSADDDYALLVHGDYRGNQAVLIEIRHDLIAHATGVREWAERLSVALSQQEQVIEAASASQ